MNAHHWSGEDERDLSRGPGNLWTSFRRAFAFARRQGLAESFLEQYRRSPAFAEHVQWAERELDRFGQAAPGEWEQEELAAVLRGR